MMNKRDAFQSFTTHMFMNSCAKWLQFGSGNILSIKLRVSYNVTNLDILFDFLENFIKFEVVFLHISKIFLKNIVKIGI